MRRNVIFLSIWVATTILLLQTGVLLAAGNVTKPSKTETSKVSKSTPPKTTKYDCTKYFGKGYCTDYILKKAGKKQKGDAATWNPNISNDKVKTGDVAIFSSPAPTGHVAYVEKVLYDKKNKPQSVTISEWNWGSASSDPEKRYCVVTTKFGVVGNRTVPISSVKGFWRP